MKNILVIGGSYFVGKVFVEELSQDPAYRIYVINRGRRPLGLPGVEEIVCDRNDSDRLTSVLPRLPWHAVVDFCAYIPDDVSRLMLALAGLPLEHFIFISTASVYAPTLDLPIREDAPKVNAPQPELGPAATYGFYKWRTEQLVADRCAQRGTAYTCLRPTIIYGKYNYAPRESYFFDRIHDNQTIVLPDNDLALFQFISVWDVAAIIKLCMGNPDTFSGCYNLSAEELVSYARLVDVLETVMETTIPTTILPVAAIESQNIPLPFPLDAHLIYSGQLIRDTLRFQYSSLTDGLRRTYDWYRDSLIDLL